MIVGTVVCFVYECYVMRADMVLVEEAIVKKPKS